MTNTAPRPTAREQLATVAAEHGWTPTVEGATTLRVQRGDVTVTVVFSARGSVTYGERLRGRVQDGYVWKNDVNKRTKVFDWLTEAEAPAVEVDPVPTVDEVAERLESGTWAPEHTVPAGVEAGQPRASVERLAELAQDSSAGGRGRDALIRDHARIVLARLDELEAERDRAWDALDAALTAGRQLHDQMRQAERERDQLQVRLDAALESELQRRGEREEALADLRRVGETGTAAMLALADQAGYPPAIPRESSDEDREREAAHDRSFAHIVTSAAEALGDPEVVIRSTAWPAVESFPLPAVSADLGDVLIRHGWRPTGDWTQVETGYWIVQVERTP